jgi:hypothetical protein
MKSKHVFLERPVGREGDVSPRLRARSLRQCALVMLLALPASAYAGAWVQRDGETLVILKYIHSDGRGWFDDGHHRTDFDRGGRSRQDQLNLYLEHGLDDRLSLIGNFYFTQVGFNADDGPLRQRRSTTGLADQELGLRYALGQAHGDPWHSALQTLISIPAYGRTKTYQPNHPSAQPALGLGDYALELRYSRGRSYTLGGRNGYVDLGGALRLRGSAASDEVRLDGTVGLDLSERWAVLGELNLIQGLGNGRGNADLQTYVATGTNYDLTKVQFSAMYHAAGMQWQFGYQQPLTGRNTSAAGGPFLAAWWRF